MPSSSRGTVPKTPSVPVVQPRKPPQNQTSLPTIEVKGVNKKTRLEKQDSIHENTKLLKKRTQTAGTAGLSSEMSLDVPVSNARRYSLPTAQIIEEAKENAYLKKQQQNNTKPADTSRLDSIREQKTKNYQLFYF